MEIFRFKYTANKARNQGQKAAPSWIYLSRARAIFSWRSASPCTDHRRDGTHGSRACLRKQKTHQRAQILQRDER
jgi:hypothetical protein